MREIISYFSQYASKANRISCLFSILILITLIFVNYYFNLYNESQRQSELAARFTPLFLLFTVSFSLVSLMVLRLEKQRLPQTAFFYVLLVAAPAIFALKAAIHTRDLLPDRMISGPWEHYLDMVLQWPLKAGIVIVAVTLLWILGKYGWPVAGLSSGAGAELSSGRRGLSSGRAGLSSGAGTGLSGRPGTLRPYFWLLAAMMPLLLLAAGQEDFQRVYPKAALVERSPEQAGHWFRVLLFEICYGIDFFTIEFFFRGFLVLAFARYMGMRAILPIAVFYCTIHFGKPLAECISSFPGGLILGVIVYHTRSIWGGLLIHLGIAWGMEAAGWLAQSH